MCKIKDTIVGYNKKKTPLEVVEEIDDYIFEEVKKLK